MDLSGSSKLPQIYANSICKADPHSPGPDVPQPFHLISNNTQDIEAMQRAEKNPQLVILSDWDHLTSSEYQKAMEDSRLGIL
jgi:hypothetical protein